MFEALQDPASYADIDETIRILKKHSMPNGQDPTSAELLNQVRAKLTEEIADLEKAIEAHKAALKVLKSRLKKLEK